MNNKLMTSGKNSTFIEANTFDHYLLNTREMIANSRLDLTPPTRDRIIEANSPYEWVPKNNSKNCGVVLIHGLLDSPFVTRDIAEFLLNQGLLTRSILLPGHGTRSGDLLEVTRFEWIKATRFAILDLKKKVEKIVVVGFSTGAALAIYHALEGLPIDGLVLSAPALRLNHPLVSFSPWVRKIGAIHPRLKWFYTSDDCDYAKYESLCFNAVAEVYRLSQDIKEKAKLKQITKPMLMVLSHEDEVIDSNFAKRFCFSQPNSHNKVIIYAREKWESLDRRLEVIISQNFSEKILDYSHTSIPISPSNPHYGKHGDYQDFSHYHANRKKITAELKARGLYQGAAQHKNIKMFWLQRLSYNPHFSDLMQKIQFFLREINIL